MIRVILLTIIMLFPCYGFTDTLKVSISENRYQTQILPQINTIISQYYSFIANQNPDFGKSLQEIQVLSIRISRTWKEKSSECKKNSSQCNLMTLYQEANKLDQAILGLQEKFWIQIKPKYDADTLIKISKYLDEIMIINYRLLHKLEEIHVLTNSVHKPKISSFDDIDIIQRDQENNIINLLFNILPSSLSSDFSHLYYSFIKPLEKWSGQPNAGAMLASKIHEYNVALNAFHMNLSKGDIAISSENLQYLRSIHQTWNAILRSLL